MKNYFTISEFNISGEPIPEGVADKILQYHIIPMNIVRDKLGVPIYPSVKSGFRPLWWELENNRSGESEHVFVNDGATDWTCINFHRHKNELLELIIKHTRYTRIAVYDTFFHCDYKGGKRKLFDKNWNLKKYL